MSSLKEKIKILRSINKDLKSKEIVARFFEEVYYKKVKQEFISDIVKECFNTREILRLLEEHYKRKKIILERYGPYIFFLFGTRYILEIKMKLPLIKSKFWIMIRVRVFSYKNRWKHEKNLVQSASKI